MKKNLLILFIILLYSNWANAQATIWQESFDPSPQAGWSIDLPNGANDPNHGVWEVNATENGATVGTCCWNAGSNNTLHVEVQNAGNGQGNNNGAYYVGGFSMNTRRKSVTPTISTLGYNNLSLSFDYLEGGTGTADNMYLEYSIDGGATWIFLGDPSKSTDINCLSSYEWGSYNISLPSACNNIANLKIGFCWQYTSGFIGTDLSCAFNDIKIDGDTIPLQTCNIPVLSLPFNGNTNDVSGNNNNGILGGGNLPFYTTDRFGNNNSAIQLGGCGNLNWVQVPNSSTLQFNNYRYSASLWYKQCDFAGMDGWGNCVPNGGFKVMYAKAGDFCAANPSIYCGTTINAAGTIDISHTNKLFSCGSGSIANPGNYSINTSMSCYDTCEWVHLVNVVDSNILKIYINGQLMQQQFIPAPDFSIANNQDLYFGRMFPGNWYPYGGTIDDVNFYNCAINQTTIDSLYGGYSNPLQGMAVASSNNDSICIGQTLQLFADTMNNATYTWTGPNGFTSTQQNPVITNFQSNQVGNYYLQVSIAGCSNSFDTIQIFQGSCSVDTCKTTQIILNTGAEENGNIIPFGQHDPNWQITSIQNTIPMIGYTVPYQPFVIPQHGAWFVPTNSRWLNRIDSYNDADGPLDTHIEYTRHFTTLQNDTFKIKLNFAADNFIDYFRVDGVNYFSAPMSSTGFPCWHCQLWTALNDTIIYLPAGCHDITVSYGDYYGGNVGPNPAGLLLEGYIKSLHNDSTILRQNCVTNTPPTLTANNTINYCANCELVSPNLIITSGLGCGNLDTVKVYFTTGYTQGQDTLKFTPQLGMNSFFNANTGVLTLYGNANYGVWETVLRTVCYSSLVANNSNANAVKNVVISLGNTLYKEDFGSVQDTLPTLSSGADYPYNSILCYNGEITNSHPGISNDVIGDGDIGTNYLFHNTGICPLTNGLAVWKSNIPLNVATGVVYEFSYYSIAEGNLNSPNLMHQITPSSGSILVSAFTSNPLQVNTWVKNSVYFTSTANTSITLSIVNNNVNLIGNDFGIDNIQLKEVGYVNINLLPKNDTTINQTICQGSSYLGYNTTGTFIDTFTSVSGCDSIRTLNLMVLNYQIQQNDTTICSSQTLPLSILPSGFNSCNINNFPNNLQIGLIGYYPFCGNANDISNLGRNGVVHGASLTSDRFGNANSAYNFNGSTDSISLIYNYTQTTELTASAWINVNPVGSNIYAILSSIDDKAIHFQISNNASANIVSYNSFVAGFGCTLPIISSIPYNNWRFLTVVYKSGNSKIFENGIQIGSSTDTFSNITATPILKIGAGYLNQRLFDGKLDEIGLWNRALSNIEVLQLYNLTSLNPNPTISWSNGASTLNTIVTPTQTSNYFVTVSHAGVSCADTIEIIKLITQDTTINQTICQGASYLGYNTTGTYIDTFASSSGCDSIRTLNLTVNPVQQFTLNHTMCQGQTYLGYASSGTYIDTFQNHHGCDSIRTLHLTVNPTQTFTINQTICQPNTYLGYNSSGTYIDTFQNQFGCDSIRTLNLIVNPITYSTISQTICQPNSYLGYNTSGTYIDTLLNTNGCDSVRTLNLIVKPMSFSSLSQTICQGQSYLGHSTTGVFNDTLLNAQGCDSVRTLTLTVNPTQAFTINQTICQPNSHLGYNTSGIYIDTFQNQYGCDSIRTLILIVNPITYSTINQTICQPSSYLGYSTTGTYIDTLLNVNGCDSVRTLNLLVNPTTSSTIVDTICEGFNVFGYTTTGTYTDILANSNGCDSARTLQLYVKPKTYSTVSAQICQGFSYLGYSIQGQYKDTLVNANGCDSVRTLNLIVHPTYFIDTVINLCNGDSLYCASAWQKTAGIYWDSLSSVNGCDSIVKTTLSFSKQLNPVILGNVEFCIGDSILLTVNNFNHYLWNTGDTTSWIYAKTSGQYSVIVNNEGLCFGYDTVNVIANPLPNVSIQFTQKDLCKYDTIQLNAFGANTYSWYSPNQSRLIGNSNPLDFSIYNSPVTVLVKGVDNNNCVNYDSVTLYYINCCGSIFVPNAFSPNGDGHNDNFKPIFNQVKYEGYEMKVFNRFGQIIYQTTDMQKGWDGTFNENQCDIGTYYYLIKTKCFESNENKILNGDINLLR